MRRPRWGLQAALLLVLGGAGFAGCGLEEEFFKPPPGKTCYEDSDCVPNGCCGQATTAVHIDDAPSCGNVTCDGTCNVQQTQCGCGVPICKDQRCTVALTTAPGCPG